MFSDAVYGFATKNDASVALIRYLLLLKLVSFLQQPVWKYATCIQLTVKEVLND